MSDTPNERLRGASSLRDRPDGFPLFQLGSRSPDWPGDWEECGRLMIGMSGVLGASLRTFCARLPVSGYRRCRVLHTHEP
nr:hypothetical protein [Paraburkholderia flava]